MLRTQGCPLPESMGELHLRSVEHSWLYPAHLLASSLERGLAEAD